MQLGRALILTLGLASPVSADRLADMRQDLAGLLLDTKRLRLEMVTTRGAGFINDGSLLDRTAAIENELQRLTGQTEELAYRISAIVRDAWDNGSLANLTKNSPLTATNAHVAIIGHITADELRRSFTSTEAA